MFYMYSARACRAANKIAASGLGSVGIVVACPAAHLVGGDWTQQSHFIYGSQPTHILGPWSRLYLLCASDIIDISHDRPQDSGHNVPTHSIEFGSRQQYSQKANLITRGCTPPDSLSTTEYSMAAIDGLSHKLHLLAFFTKCLQTL